MTIQSIIPCNSYVSINHICEVRISTKCRFPFKGGGGEGPLENDHEFPIAGDIELLGRSLMAFCHNVV